MSDNSSNSASSHHHHLRVQCGACGYFFRAGDSVVAIICEATRRCAVSGPHEYPEQDPDNYHGNDPVVVEAPCSDCESETATVHVDCLNLFGRLAGEADVSEPKIHRLWAASVGRSPWEGCQPLLVRPEHDTMLVIEQAERVSGFSRLKDLPTEIAMQVLGYLGSDSNPFLRFCGVTELVRGIASGTHADVQNVSLFQVQSWHRGSPPTMTQERCRTPVLLTLDARGIKSLTRPASGQSVPAQVKPNLYMEIPQGQDDVLVTFELGICRLAPEGSHNMTRRPIWNVPVQPNRDDGTVIPSGHLDDTTRFDVLDLGTCSGLTLFVYANRVCAIHAHTKTSPLATVTHERLPVYLQSSISWIYVPFAAADELLALGVWMKSKQVLGAWGVLSTYWSLHLRTRLLGDFTAGPLFHEKESFVFEASRDSRLLLTAPFCRDDIPASIIGLHPKTREVAVAAPPAAWRPEWEPVEPKACYSAATLTSVACVSIYRHREIGILAGLVIDYRNGAQRALGSCRIGVDVAERCEDLCHIRYARTDGNDHFNVRVEVAEEGNDDDREGGWSRFVEGGILEMWVAPGTVAIKVTAGNKP